MLAMLWTLLLIPGLTGPRVQLYRVWQPLTGAPVMLVAIELDDGTPVGDGRWSGPFDFRLRTWAHRASPLPSTEWRALVGSVTGRPRGLFVLPGSGATDSWQLRFGGRGVASHTTPIERLSPLDGTTPVLSDIVVGQVGRSPQWWDPGEPMPVSAGGVFRRGRPLELLAQLKSQVALEGLRVQIAITDVEQAVTAAQARLTLEMELHLEPGITTIRRSLAFDQLPAGRYRVTIGVRTSEGTMISQREREVEVRD